MDRAFLLKQLQGSGVPQLLQVMGEGFPHRVALKEAGVLYALDALFLIILSQYVAVRFSSPHDQVAASFAGCILDWYGSAFCFHGGEMKLEENLEPFALAAAVFPHNQVISAALNPRPARY